MLSYRLLAFVAAVLEAYRRIQWNFFRLENEVGTFEIENVPC